MKGTSTCRYSRSRFVNKLQSTKIASSIYHQLIREEGVHDYRNGWNKTGKECHCAQSYGKSRSVAGHRVLLLHLNLRMI